MNIYFSKTTNGFYFQEVHGDGIPEDAIEITFEDYQNLISGQANGKIIGIDDSGKPILVQPEPPSQEELNQRRKNQILFELKKIDETKIRAITDFILTDDKTRLVQLEERANVLREELSKINASE